MPEQERLRQFVLGKPFRRTVFALLAALFVAFMYSSLSQGRVADRCAEALAAAVAAKDRAYLSAHVRNPSLEETLLGAPHAELAFVRPVDTEWSRIGFLIRESSTATIATPVFILLSHEESQEECSFIQDYER